MMQRIRSGRGKRGAVGVVGLRQTRNIDAHCRGRGSQVIGGGKAGRGKCGFQKKGVHVVMK